MANINELLAKLQRLSDVQEAECNSIDKLGPAWLDSCGSIFGLVLGQTLGFQWLQKLLSYIPAEKHNFHLPYLNHRFSLGTQNFTESIEALREKLTSGAHRTYYSKMYMEHYFNKFEFPFVILHWLAANIGKILGWLVASPFAALGYAGKKVYYGVKELWARHEIQQEILKFNSIDLASKCFLNFNYAPPSVRDFRGQTTVHGENYFVGAHRDEFFVCISPQQMLAGIFKEERNSVPGDNNDFLNQLYKPIMGRDGNHGSHVLYFWDEYQKSRQKYLKSQRNWALTKMILTGILVIPLFFTIPSYNKLKLLEESEKREMDTIRNNFQDHVDPRYGYAAVLSSVGCIGEAMQAYGRVQSTSTCYADAQSELGYAALAAGDAAASVTHFKASGESHAQHISRQVVANPNINITELNHSVVFASTATTLAEVKGLDEDEAAEPNP